jgi:hypothetical protein
LARAEPMPLSLHPVMSTYFVFVCEAIYVRVVVLLRVEHLSK